MATTVAQRFVTVQGPVKVEYLSLTTVTSADTVTTTMQRPLFAFGVDNTGALSVNTSITISGKTLTITNSSYAGAGICSVLVVGF